MPERMRRLDARCGFVGSQALAASTNFPFRPSFPGTDRTAICRRHLWPGRAGRTTMVRESRDLRPKRTERGPFHRVMGGHRASEKTGRENGEDNHEHALLRLLRTAVPPQFVARAGAALLLTRLPPPDRGPPPRLGVAATGGTDGRRDLGSGPSGRCGNLSANRDGVGARLRLIGRHTHSAHFLAGLVVAPLKRQGCHTI